MNASHVVLKLMLDAIDQPLDLCTERHLLIQRKVYLTQVMGLDLAYRFIWCSRGPYSRELACDVVTAKELLDGGDETYRKERLRPEVRRLATRAATLWRDPPAGVDDPAWLELLTSLYYLTHVAYWPRGTPTSFAGIFRGLVECKPHFVRREPRARAAWARLAEYGLRPRRSQAGA